jgi:hypothetical protein
MNTLIIQFFNSVYIIKTGNLFVHRITGFLDFFHRPVFLGVET